MEQVPKTKTKGYSWKSKTRRKHFLDHFNNVQNGVLQKAYQVLTFFVSNCLFFGCKIPGFKVIYSKKVLHICLMHIIAFFFEFKRTYDIPELVSVKFIQKWLKRVAQKHAIYTQCWVHPKNIRFRIIANTKQFYETNKVVGRQRKWKFWAANLWRTTSTQCKIWGWKRRRMDFMSQTFALWFGSYSGTFNSRA